LFLRRPSARNARRLGPAAFAQRVGAAWLAFADRVPKLIKIEHFDRRRRARTAYTGFVEGKADPRRASCSPVAVLFRR